MSINYRTPLDVATIFPTDVDVGEFLEYLVTKLIGLQVANKNNEKWISPIVYSRPGKAFNVDYNSLIKGLAEYVGIDAIEGDFMLSESASAGVVNNGIFLIVAIFENYYNLVRVRQKAIDLSKFRTMKIFNVTDKFYNVMAIQNGDNFKRFSAVPFSGSRVKSLISLESYDALLEISDKDEYTQVAFGINQFNALVEKIGFSPEHVSI